MTESCLSNIGGSLCSIKDINGDIRFKGKKKKNRSFQFFSGPKEIITVGFNKD